MFTLQPNGKDCESNLRPQCQTSLLLTKEIKKQNKQTKNYVPFSHFITEIYTFYNYV